MAAACIGIMIVGVYQGNISYEDTTWKISHKMLELRHDIISVDRFTVSCNIPPVLYELTEHNDDSDR